MKTANATCVIAMNVAILIMFGVTYGRLCNWQSTQLLVNVFVVVKCPSWWIW
ncbi:hypothetical protein [uncultured Prevotella sp.]|uniref:hypothetical protein n=1 Tax=uncultured Prevotella sp. TaxID=159272 RepID=UPI002637B970|nr:hypothetical protein [uncultured Prevotella sp.]